MRTVLAVLLMLFPALAAAQAPQRGEPPVTVEVVRDGARWTAEFRFARPAPAWLFVRSALTETGNRPWRPQSWTVETPGVRLERRGYYDVLVAADGGPVPARVRVAFRPFGDRLQGDYDPALLFSDGSVALYSEQFDAVAMADPAAIARLPSTLGEAGVPYSATRVRFRDASRPPLMDGRRTEAAEIEDDGDGSYVLFGPLAPVTTESLTLIVDPELPGWMRRTIGEATPRILDRYVAALGPRPGPRPTIMVSWRGATPGMTSQGGSTLFGLVVMRMEGAGLLQPTPAARQANLWFIAHEAAHFWLGQTIRYDTPLDSWITEGGSDLLAFRAVAAVDPGYDPRLPLQTAIEDCARLSAGRGIARALERNEYRAYYACGAVFALAAEAASGESFERFVRRLIDANRDDRSVTRAEWLAMLTRVSRDRGLARDIAALLDRGSADPAAALAALLRRAGVPFTRRADGMPVLS